MTNSWLAIWCARSRLRKQVVPATEITELKPGRPEVVGGEGHDVLGTQGLCQVDPGAQRLHSLMLLVDQDENPAQVVPCQGLVERVAPVLLQAEGQAGPADDRACAVSSVSHCWRDRVTRALTSLEPSSACRHCSTAVAASSAAAWAVAVGESPRVGLTDPAALSGREQGAARQDKREAGRGLPMRSCTGSRAAREPAVPHDDLVVPGGHRVVEHSEGVWLGVGEQRAEHILVQCHADARRQMLGDRAPGQLVAEGSTSPRMVSTPAASAWPTGARSGCSIRSSPASTPPGTTARRLTADWASGLSFPTRASTASTTVGGTSTSGAVASTSVTKNGLPCVSRKRSAASPSAPAAKL